MAAKKEVGISRATEEKQKEKGEVEDGKLLYKSIPEFSLMLRTQDSGSGLLWYKVDTVCGTMNQILERHQGRQATSFSHTHFHDDVGDDDDDDGEDDDDDDVGNSSSSSSSCCDRNLFIIQKPALKILKCTYGYSGKPPNLLSKCVCVNNTVYCVGGDRDIWAFPNVTCQMNAKHPPKPLSYFQEYYKDEDSDYIPRLNLSRFMIQCNFSQYSYYPNGKKKKKNGKVVVDTAYWTWGVGCPLLSPRFLPVVVTFGNKLYLFGGNRSPFPETEKPEDVPFAEVYDPKLDLFSALPEPPFHRIGSKHLLLVPLLGDEGEEKILVVSKACSPIPSAAIMFVYDTHDQSWTEFKDDLEDDLFYALVDIYGDAVPLAQQNTTYWITDMHSTDLSLCCYDWKSRKLYQGSFVHHFKHHCRPNFLLHLQADLFCIIDQHITRHDFPYPRPFTQFHFILLRVSKNHSCTRLDTQLLGCHCCYVDGVQFVRYAHLLWKQSQDWKKEGSYPLDGEEKRLKECLRLA